MHGGTRDIVIDLGDDWELPEEPDRPPRRPFERRRILILAFLAVLLLPLAIAGRPTLASPPLTELAILSHPGARGARAIVDDLVLVSGGNGNITAFELDGTVRWRHQLKGLPGIESIQAAAGLILITADRGPPATMATVALDPQTGRELWTMAGGLSLVDGGAILSYLGERVTVLDRETMRPRWSAGDLAGEPLADGTGVLLLHRSGALSERHMVTGALVRSVPVRLAERTSYTLMISRDVVVAQPNSGRLSRRDSLWFDRFTLQPVSATIHWIEWRDCGPVICGRHAGDNRTMIIDPEGGEVLRSLPEHQSATATPAGLLVMTYRALGSFSAIETVDPLTGESRLALAGWNTVAQRDFGDVAPILIWPAHRQTHVGILRADGLHILAKVPHELSGCLYEQPVLMCPTGEGKLGLWRLAT